MPVLRIKLFGPLMVQIDGKTLDLKHRKGDQLLVLLALWTPSLNRSNTRDMAAALRAEFGAGPYCFHGQGVYLPLCFAMRQEIPYFKTPDELSRATNASPELVVLQQADESSKAAKPVDLPPGFEQIGTIGADDQRILIFRRSRTQDRP